VIRPAHRDELAAVGDLTHDAYAVDGFVTPADEYAAVLRDADARAIGGEVYVATDADGRLLGTVTFCPEGSHYRELAGTGEGEFRMLAVAADAPDAPPVAPAEDDDGARRDRYRVELSALEDALRALRARVDPVLDPSTARTIDLVGRDVVELASRLDALRIR